MKSAKGNQRRYPVEIWGGAFAGGARVTVPFAVMSANENQIVLRIFPFSCYKFTPHQVLSISKDTSTSVRINHTLIDYPSQILFIFWEADYVLNEIHQVGFIPSARQQDIPNRKGNPVRRSSIILGIVIWNLLVLLPRFYPSINYPLPPPYFAIVGMTAIFALIPYVPLLQKMILKPGKRVGEIKPVLDQLTFLGCLMLIVSAIFIS